MAGTPLASLAAWPRDDRTSRKALCHKLLGHGNAPKNNRAAVDLWPPHPKRGAGICPSIPRSHGRSTKRAISWALISTASTMPARLS